MMSGETGAPPCEYAVVVLVGGNTSDEVHQYRQSANRPRQQVNERTGEALTWGPGRSADFCHNDTSIGLAMLRSQRLLEELLTCWKVVVIRRHRLITNDDNGANAAIPPPSTSKCDTAANIMGKEPIDLNPFWVKISGYYNFLIRIKDSCRRSERQQNDA
jgi:hypothetical protein